MYVKDLPLLHILSEETISKLSISKGWTKHYAATWSYLYFKNKLPPDHNEVINYQPNIIKKEKSGWKLKE